MLYRISYLNLHFPVEDNDAFSLLGIDDALVQRRCLTCLFRIIKPVCLVLASCSFILPVSLPLCVSMHCYLQKKIVFPVSMYCFAIHCKPMEASTVEVVPYSIVSISQN